MGNRYSDHMDWKTGIWMRFKGKFEAIASASILNINLCYHLRYIKIRRFL